MLDGDEYEVELKIGRDIPDVKDVKSIISRQLLCEMVARIEDDIHRWKDRDTSVKCGVCGRVEAGMPQLVNHNYLITGVRGSGKTTFLNYVISTLVGEMNPFVPTGYEENGKLQSRYTASHYIETERKNVVCKLLCRFDPSSHEVRHGYFLLSVVAAIQSKLAEVYSSSKNNGIAFQENWNRCKSFLNCLDIGIARLSKGRLALSDMTEEQVKQLRTENAELEEQIRSNFANVVELLCQLCCVDAFIISIDDADTRSAQCADVIEDLRLYVTHPRLIVLLAGDRDLYMERIREIHFKEYDKDYHIADEKGKEARMNYVMSHANQYFIKQFPVENHYELRDLNYLVQKRDPIVCRLIANGGKNSPSGYDGRLQEAVRKIFSIVINREDRDIEEFVSLFMSLPMRSIIQILKGWSLMEVWKKLSEVEKNRNNELVILIDRKELNSQRRQLRNAVKYSLSRILLSEIRYGDYSFDKLDVDNPRTYFSLLLRHCQNMNDTEHGYFLSGDIGDKQEEKYMALMLAVASGNMLQGFSGFLSYLLYGPASVSLYAKASEQVASQKKDDVDFLRSEFNQYIHVRSWDSPTRWARNANMIWCHDPDFGGIHTGILRLRHNKMVELLNDAVMVDTLLDGNHESSFRALAMLASMSISSDRDNSYFISLFHFLGFILKCVQVCEAATARFQAKTMAKQEEKSEDKEQEKTGKQNVIIEAVKELLVDLYPIKSSRNPSWLIKEGQTQSFNTERVRLSRQKEKNAQGQPLSEDELEEMETLRCLLGNNDVAQMSEKISEWYTGTVCAEQGINNLSVHSIGDLWADMYYGLKRICHNTNLVNNKKQDVDRTLENHRTHIETFYKAMCFFFNHLCGATHSKQDNLLDHYLRCIKEFPLSSYFLSACQDFQNATKGTSDIGSPASAELADNAPSAESSAKGGKGKKNTHADSQPPLPLPDASDASQKSEQ